MAGDTRIPEKVHMAIHFTAVQKEQPSEAYANETVR
jgi:hypothetical protein